MGWLWLLFEFVLDPGANMDGFVTAVVDTVFELFKDCEIRIIGTEMIKVDEKLYFVMPGISWSLGRF